MKVKPIEWKEIEGGLPETILSVDPYKHVNIDGITVHPYCLYHDYVISKTDKGVGNYTLYYRDMYAIAMSKNLDEIKKIAQQHRLEYVQSFIESE
jgi:hypothetical protein